MVQNVKWKAELCHDSGIHCTGVNTHHSLDRQLKIGIIQKNSHPRLNKLFHLRTSIDDRLITGERDTGKHIPVVIAGLSCQRQIRVDRLFFAGYCCTYHYTSMPRYASIYRRPCVKPHPFRQWPTRDKVTFSAEKKRAISTR